MSALLSPSVMSVACHAQNSVRLAEHATASFSGRTSASYSCSQQSSITCLRGSQMHKQLYQRQQEPRQATCFATKSERRRQQQQAEEDDKGEDAPPSGFLASGAALVNTLLFGAASRIERGTSVCVSCRGTGTMICKDCDATGVVKAKKSSGQSGSRSKTMVGKRSQDYIVSNRCRSCKGHGRLECPHCDGIGKRNVVQRDMWM